MLVSGKVNVHVPTWFVICFLEFDRIVLSSRFEEEMSFSTIGSMYGVFIFIYIYIIQINQMQVNISYTKDPMGVG